MSSASREIATNRKGKLACTPSEQNHGPLLVYSVLFASRQVFKHEDKFDSFQTSVSKEAN